MIKKWKLGVLGSLFAGGLIFTFPMCASAKGVVIPINEKTFPDNAFREYVCENIDTNGDGVLVSSEAMAVEEIWLGYHPNGYEGEPIYDLTGIEYFTNLKMLDFIYHSVTSVDLSRNTKLTFLQCGSNELTSLDIGDKL